MFNPNNFARPESVLAEDGLYVPTPADLAEMDAAFDDADSQDWEDDAYEVDFMDHENPAWDY